MDGPKQVNSKFHDVLKRLAQTYKHGGTDGNEPKGTGSADQGGKETAGAKHNENGEGRQVDRNGVRQSARARKPVQRFESPICPSVQKQRPILARSRATESVFFNPGGHRKPSIAQQKSTPKLKKTPQRTRRPRASSTPQPPNRSMVKNDENAPKFSQVSDALCTDGLELESIYRKQDRPVPASMQGRRGDQSRTYNGTYMGNITNITANRSRAKPPQLVSSWPPLPRPTSTRPLLGRPMLATQRDADGFLAPIMRDPVEELANVEWRDFQHALEAVNECRNPFEIIACLKEIEASLGVALAQATAPPPSIVGSVYNDDPSAVPCNRNNSNWFTNAWMQQ